MRGQSLALSALLVLAAACASPRYRAPVEDRRSGTGPAPVATAPADARAPAAEDPSAARPGFVTVKPGDTLMKIAADAGQNWRDIVRWNNLPNPDVIEVGQTLRVTAPAAADLGAPVDGPVAAKPVTTGRVEARSLESRPLDSKPADVKPGDKPQDARAAQVAATPPITPPLVVVPPLAPASVPAAPAASPSAAPPLAAASSASAGDEAIAWIWPAAGSIGSTFDGPRNKGVTILGKPGDPIVAAADGRVIYAGSSLRGYGNMVIIKHNSAYITAYAHNRTLLVKDEQVVRKGQRIAEMGSSDAERVQLHFEVRKNGVAVDPLKHLPAR